MILRNIKIIKYRAFYDELDIHIENGVTVLIGKNDTGKSSILRLISLLCNGRTQADVRLLDDDRNKAHAINSSLKPEDDPEVKCIATYEVNVSQHELDKLQKNTTNNQDARIQNGDEIDYEFQILRNQWNDIAYRHSATNRGRYNPSKRGLLNNYSPNIIYPQNSELIDSSFCEDTENIAAQKLIKFAVGSSFNLERLRLSEDTRADAEKQASMKLNSRIREYLPRSLEIILDLRIQLDDEKNILKFRLFIDDNKDTTTLIHLRGHGVQSIVTILIHLIATGDPSKHTIILLDEPENSLHADTQRSLRRLLEHLAESPKIQIIYTTHSPSMINTFDPSGIRLLERIIIPNRGITTTQLVKNPFGNNYETVRKSLGIIPSDSLLYSSITLIVEGETEATCIPFLLEYLHETNVEGFSDVPQLMSEFHIGVASGATQALIWCKFAERQGSFPIAFLDGDNKDIIEKIRNADVQVVHLKEGTEFEDYVDIDTYIDAIKNVFSLEDIKDTPLTSQAFNQWSSEYKTKGTSKKMQKWIKSIYRFEPPKTDVMKWVVEKHPEQISPEFISKLRELMQIIRETVKTYL